MSLVIEQPYNDYTAQDHAVWRYVMRQNVRSLPHVAHESYLEGLNRTGISVDQIPHMHGMNRILKEIGWAAVAVDGFIPPSAFMEFQAYNVLVIAADIRSIDQIQYTPAPDIIHEAAGHAPIIADPQYAGYLRDFGILGSKAFSSKYDQDIYEAIRHLSILKADPYIPAVEIERAEKALDELVSQTSGPSEMALLRNLHWWTVEYGLIGTVKQPKIYGAGLLSSIGESFTCLQDNVIKLPYSIDAQHVNFDITTRQPQLFVTPDFEHLSAVLNEFSTGMSFNRGGLTGLTRAIESGKICTVVYTSGLQVSGVLNHLITNDKQPVYLMFTGHTQLSFEDQVIPGQGVNAHQQGFGAPVGFLKGVATPLEFISNDELQSMGIAIGKRCRLEFESGVRIDGILSNIINRNARNILLSFSDCIVRYRDQVLFEPSWGSYDMAVGAGIRSCFSGPVDPDSFGYSLAAPEEKTHKIIHSEESRKLHQHYARVREIRETEAGFDSLENIFRSVSEQHPVDWLVLLEIYELIENRTRYNELGEDILRTLKKRAIEDENLLKLIQDGLAMVKSPANA
jgi:phenylalanine-4-hydroxylase